MRRFGKVIAVIGLVALLSLGAAVAVSARGGGLFGRSFAPRAGGQEGVAETLGTTVEELQDALRAGKTLADLAEEKNVDLQDLKDAADAARDEAVREAIEQAVEDDDLTAEQAEWMLEGVDSAYGLSGRFPRAGFGKFGFGMGTEQTGLNVAADALNMTEDELSLQLWAGESLADLAEAQQGVALEDVQSAIEEARQAAIEQAVENGYMTEEQAEWMREGVEKDYMPQRGFGSDVPFEGRRGHGGSRRGGHPGGCGLWEEGEETDAGHGARFLAPIASFLRSM